MSNHEPCKSWRGLGETFCADGFITKPFCSGKVGCISCGHVSERHLPNCLKEDLPAHWLNEDGSPAYYRPAPTKPSGTTETQA